MRKLFGILVIILALSGVNVVKAQEIEREFDLTTLDCKTLLTMDGDDKDLTILFFHGFMSAKNNEMIVNTVALAEATDEVVNYCIDNPQETLLNVFTKYRSGR